MSMPPPGPWPPPQSPQPGEPQGFPPEPPQWGPPQPWSQPPPPQNGDNRSKWILGGLALLVVVVVAVVATLLITRDGSSSNPPTASAPPSSPVDTSDIASADDKGPVEIITEDPTCAAWGPINDTLASEQNKGWSERNPSVPATAWTPGQRNQYEAVANAMRSAADQTTALTKLTPHRVMRELYEQSIAYWRAYADATTSYVPADDHLALVASSTSGALVWICAAVNYGSASARAPLVARAAPPSELAMVGDPADPSRFLNAFSPVCSAWIATIDEFNSATSVQMNTIDPNIPAIEWSGEQRAAFTTVMPAMRNNADTMQQLGIQSDNPTWEDFAVLAAQYQRAYVQSIPTYTRADNYLSSAAARLAVTISEACSAVGTS